MMLSSIWVKISAGFAVVIGILGLMLKSARRDKEVAEIEARTEKANRKLSQKKNEITEDIGLSRAKFDLEAKEKESELQKQLRDYEYEESSNADFIADVSGMLNKSSNKTRGD